MQFSDYATEAMTVRSNSYSPHDLSANLVQSAIGLSGEVGEIGEALRIAQNLCINVDAVNMDEEMGDCCWYLAEGLVELEYDIGELPEIDIDTLIRQEPSMPFTFRVQFEVFPLLAEAAGKYLDIVKKTLFHGRSLDHSKLSHSLAMVVAAIKHYASLPGASSMDHILETNLNKLIRGRGARYKSGFSKEASLNRDTDAERKILEGQA